MAVDKLVDSTQLDSDLTSVANAIRAKSGGSSQLAFPSGFVSEIGNIPSGGITPTGTISITQNGTTDVTNYASASVNVPNSYTASDEGKVVSNGALVAQTSDTATQNGTVDTTLINSLEVNVQGSGGYTLDEIGGVVYVSGQGTRNTDISGAIDITVYATRTWAFTETAITSAVVRTTGNISGYALRERTFSACPNLTDILYMPGAANHGIGSYAAQNCPSLTRVRITGTINTFSGNAFNSCPNLTDIYVPWAEGAVNNAPWSATNATVHYNTVFDSDGNIVG